MSFPIEHIFLFNSSLVHVGTHSPDFKKGKSLLEHSDIIDVLIIFKKINNLNGNINNLKIIFLFLQINNISFIDYFNLFFNYYNTLN